jgi:hypothetical protein
MSFRGNSPKNRQNGETFVRKDVKRGTIPKVPNFFCPLDFGISDSYRAIGSPM